VPDLVGLPAHRNAFGLAPGLQIEQTEFDTVGTFGEERRQVKFRLDAQSPEAASVLFRVRANVRIAPRRAHFAHFPGECLKPWDSVAERAGFELTGDFVADQ
jgi:hypothetical protein